MTWFWPDWLFHLTVGVVLCQTIGTLRHEFAHVIASKLSGDNVKEMYIFPHMSDGMFYWGRVTWTATANSKTSVHRYLAPYYVAALVLTAGILFLKYIDGPWEHNTPKYFTLWIFCVMNLVISPAVDILYNLYKWWRHGRGDFAKAAKE